MIYTIQQLIGELTDLPPHAEAQVWHDGNRYIVQSVNLTEPDIVNLNLQPVTEPKTLTETETEIGENHENRSTNYF